MTDRIETITVESATKMQGRNGVQWQVKMLIPKISKYATPSFMPVEWADEIIAGTSHRVGLTKGNLKNGKSGQYDSDYYWNITSWDTTDSEFPDVYTPENTSAQTATRSAPPAQAQERWEDKPRHEREGSRFGMLYNQACETWRGEGWMQRDPSEESDEAFYRIFQHHMTWEQEAAKLFNAETPPVASSHPEPEAQGDEPDHTAFIRKFWPLVEDEFTTAEIDSLLGMNVRDYLTQNPDSDPEGLASHVRALKEIQDMGAQS